MAAQGYDPRDYLFTERKYGLYLRLAGGLPRKKYRLNQADDLYV